MPVATLAYVLAESLTTPYAIWAWLVVAGLLAAAVQVGPIRRRLTVDALLVASGSALAVGVVAAWALDDSLLAHRRPRLHDGLGEHRARDGRGVPARPRVPRAAPRARTRSGSRSCSRRSSAPCSCPASTRSWGLPALSALAGVVALVWPPILASRLDRPACGRSPSSAPPANAGLRAVRLRDAAHAPPDVARPRGRPGRRNGGRGRAPGGGRRDPARSLLDRRASRAATLLVYSGGAACLWTLAAAILGAEQLVADAGLQASVHDHFQQGHVLVSISWVVIGLALVVLSLRGDHRALRVGGISLLFLALGKLFLYDLAFLTAMARAISFIVSGSVLLLAALLLQRFAPQVKAALGDDSPEPSSRHSPVGW